MKRKKGKKIEGDFHFPKKKSELNSLKPVLKNWPKIISKYCNIHTWPKRKVCDFVPYVYNERAIVSTLSAAAWVSNGWVALEEYNTYKRERKGKKEKPGRVDLYIANKKYGFCFEAKIKWRSFNTPRSRLVNSIEKTLDKAVKEVKRNPKDEGIRIGLVFVMPRLKKNAGALEVKGKITRLVGWLTNLDIEYDFLAWSFPKIARGYLDVDDNLENPAFYPGVFLVGRKL